MFQKMALGRHHLATTTGEVITIKAVEELLSASLPRLELHTEELSLGEDMAPK